MVALGRIQIIPEKRALIVDVENVFRRLWENAALLTLDPALEVIARASVEVRNSILYATLLNILVFLPLLGLSEVEGAPVFAHCYCDDRFDGGVFRCVIDDHPCALFVSAQTECAGCRHEHRSKKALSEKGGFSEAVFCLSLML